MTLICILAYKHLRVLNRKIYSSWLAFFDLIAALAAWVVFYYVRKDLLNESYEPFSIIPFKSGAVVTFFWLILYVLSDFYKDIFRKSRIREILNFSKTTTLGVLVIFFILFLDDEGVSIHTHYYKTLGAYFISHFSIGLLIKISSLSVLKNLIKKGKVEFNTLIIGSNESALNIYTELQSINHLLGLKFLGYVHVFDSTKSLLDKELRHFGNWNTLNVLIGRLHIEQLIIAVEPSEHKKIQEVINSITDRNVKISIIPDLYQIITGSVKVNHLFGLPIIDVKTSLMPVWQKILKRVFDIVMSSSVLILASPLYLIVSILTKNSSSGPIFFGQIRIGIDGKPFVINKFRSMYTNAEEQGPKLSSDNDPRITPWGRYMRKTRLDEFPQFWNVLKGDMSIVGPRPERKFFIDKISEQAPHYKHLLRVRPGITSLGQVKYGYAENVEQMVKRLEFDIVYIENMSLAMDFRIILYTILVVVQGRGK